MVNASYVVDAFMPYKEDGLITTLSKAPDSVTVIPDPSILPSASSFNGRKLTSEQVSYLGQTIHTVLAVLAHPRTLVLPKILSSFKKKTGEEIVALKRYDPNNLIDRYQRFGSKLECIRLSNPGNGLEGKFSIFFEALGYLKRELDLNPRDANEFDDKRGTLAFASVTAITNPDMAHAILTLDNSYLALFDSLFGIYMQQSSEERKNLQKAINNFDLRIISPDLDQANQPLIIKRATRGKIKPSEEYLRAPTEKRNEVLTQLKKYFVNLNRLLRGEAVMVDGRSFSVQMPTKSSPKNLEGKLEPVEVKTPEKITQQKKEINYKDQAAIDEELKKTIKNEDTQSQNSIPGEDKKDEKLDDKIQKSEKDLEKDSQKLKIDEAGLTAIYEETRLIPESIPDLYSEGKLHTKIRAYKTLREIALHAGAKKIVAYLDNDLNNLKRYLDKTKKLEIDEIREKLEKETRTLEDCLKLLEPAVELIVSKEEKISLPKKEQTKQEIRPAEISKKDPLRFDVQRAITIRKKSGLFQQQLGKQLGGLTQGEISKMELGKIQSPEKLGERGLRYFRWLFEQDGFNPYNLNFEKPQEGVAPSTSGSSE